MSDPDNSSLERRLKFKELELNSMLEIAQAINQNLSADKLFKIYEFVIRGQMGIEKLILFNKGEENWECPINYGTNHTIDDFDLKEITAFEKTSALSGVNGALKEFQFIIPVYHNNNLSAVAVIGGLESSENISDGPVTFVQTITNIITVAIENQQLFDKQLQQESLRKELEVAAQMQTMLIPTALPKNDHIEMDAFYRPHHDVGGDYYDVLQINPNEIGFCIADISGKGIPAALLMANFQANQRTLMRQNYELNNIVTTLNQRVIEITKGDKFITLFIARYNFKTKKLYYVNAGHNPPMYFDGKKLQSLEEGTTLLGVFDELPEISMGSLKVSDGSRLVTYTDGLTELENETEEQFGVERLSEFIEQHHALSLTDFNAELYKALDDYRNKTEFNDDITLLTCQF